MEWLIFVFAVFAGLIIFFVRGALEERKRKNRQLESLRENYGRKPEREYSLEEYESISHYALFHTGEGCRIDDITWEDLDFDRLYRLMNHSLTSAGDEYLYALLRKPSFDEEELRERERLILHFMEHEEDRLKLQKVFLRIGRTGKISISDYIYLLDDLEREDNLKHYLSIGAMLAALGLVFLSPGMGMLFVIFAASVNIKSYLRRKGEIAPYLTTFTYILRLLDGIDRFDAVKIEACASYLEELKALKHKFDGFRKNSFLVMGGGGMGDLLEVPLEYARMFLHLDLIKFNRMLKDFQNQVEDVERIIEIAGYLESMISIGAFRRSLPCFCVPEFTEDIGIWAADIGHPLIDDPVVNSVEAARGVLVTGSNASGKSTFLRTMAVNAILAQTVHTVCAAFYRTAFFRIYSSMSLRDSLESGESYFMVELKALKRILTATAKKSPPVLCFVDEVLRGTNTVERVAASGQILKSLAKDHVLCFAATHDIELTYMLESYYSNYHFEEEVEEDDIFFSYELKKGRAVSRNAIKLLGIMGYDGEMIGEAEKAAAVFLEKGIWEVIR